MAIVVESEVQSLESLHEKTLTSCHEALKKKLDINEILAPMNQKNLLTSEDKHVLSDTSKSTSAKVSYVVEILPRKGEGWWGKFIASLKESTAGTAHEDLASILTNRLTQNMHEFPQQTLTQPSLDVYPHHDSSHVPSGISRALYDFMPSIDSEYTEYKSRSDKAGSDIVKLRPDLADVLAPIVQLKEQLDNVQYSYKIMKNQVGLLRAFDNLLENTKRFRDALSSLLELYIDKFKTKKRHCYLKLTTVERSVIQIIEDITECTEDIDIDEEKEVWTQCAKKIEKNRDLIKEALYSEDTDEMAAIQRTLKLDKVGTQAADEWIASRKQVVELGKKSLDKLDEMREQDNALITSVYDTIHRRVKAGEDCLNAWSKWVDQRR